MILQLPRHHWHVVVELSPGPGFASGARLLEVALMLAIVHVRQWAEK